MQRYYWLLLFIGFALAGNAQREPAFYTDYSIKWVDSVMATLTLDEKIGQLLMPRGNVSGKPHDVEKLKAWVRDYKIGGLVFFASSPTVQARLTNELQSISRVPLFIGEDFEWGLAMRMDSTDRFPYAMTLGAMAGHEDLIEAMGKEVGRQCRRLGVHINYAPVVDINSNIDNPVINFRSFGENRDAVASKALAYMKGLQSAHVIATAKHFPGHGDTQVDSHKELPVISHDSLRLHTMELYPFQKLIDAGVGGIMTAHLDVSVLEPQGGLAATFSNNIVTGLLRQKMGFKGLTFTDAMDMKGAIKNFGPGESLVQALLAGNDVLETFEDVPIAVAAIKAAIADGKISTTLLDEKVRRILIAKSWVGLDRYQPIEINNLVADLNSTTSDLLNRQFAEATLTLLKNKGDILPVKKMDSRIAVVAVDGIPANTFQEMCSRYTNVDEFIIPVKSSDSLVQSLVIQLSCYDLVVVSLHLKEIRPSAKYSVNEQNISAITQLSRLDNAILCLFGNIYALPKLPAYDGFKAIVVAYQQWAYAEAAAAQAIFGALPFTGKLPVTLTAGLEAGSGIEEPTIYRMAYGSPEQVSMDGNLLGARIDSIVDLGLKARAFPGAVVQVVKDGRTIYQKAYGSHTYDNTRLDGPSDKPYETGQKTDAMDFFDLTANKDQQPQTKSQWDANAVLTSDVYDLASVTKITTSALAIMQLMSEDKFRLDEPWVTYVPELKGSNKAGLTFRNLLTHRAGLKAWIPFWHYAVDSLATAKHAVKLKPTLAAEFQYKEKKPFFLWRWFGKKNKRELLYLPSVQENAALWQKCLGAECIVWKKNAFQNHQTKDHDIQLHANLWMHKKYRAMLFEGIKNSPVNAGQGYVYSDLHYYYYPAIVKQITGKNFDQYLYDTYRSLGANSLCFNPLETTSHLRLVPTEYDSLFRRTQIYGHVHDEGAAILDGRAGHAGLFGNANDLAKLMLMYLQKGSYGGKQYFSPQVIEECTSYQFPEEGNRRGIAFDKPDLKGGTNAPSLASPLSYGHNGYTGTYVWVDPAYNLIYIFLSNRVNSTRKNNKISEMNIRTKIGDAIYESMGVRR